MSYDYLFRFIVIGDQNDTFNEYHEPTIGIEFAIRTIEINNEKIRLQVWDTAGQEEFKSLARSYYRAAAGVLLVYDITKRSSFKNIKKWLDEARYNGHSKMSYMLIGNKSDLKHERSVSTEEGKDLAFSEGFNFIETSALTAENVEKAFYELTYKIYEKLRKGDLRANEEGTDGVKPGKMNMKEKRTVSLNKDSVTADCVKDGCFCGS